MPSQEALCSRYPPTTGSASLRVQPLRHRPSYRGYLLTRRRPIAGQSWFGVNEVRLGIPFPSGPWAVMRYIAATRPRFNELILSGELVRLDAAHREYGLVDHTVSSAADLTRVRPPR